MQYEAIENTLSISRFSTYRNAVITTTGVNCNTTALSLYEWNANLSSSFLFPLHIYEVTLRNAISDAIASRYGSDWPTNHFFQNSLNYKNKKGLLSAIGSEYQGLGKVLPEIKLSWWEEMLTRRHDGRIWNNCMNDIFPNAHNLTVGQIRACLKNACFSIRKIRNRIAHHEPIFNQNSLQDIYPMIETTVAMRCDETKSWLSQIEEVSNILGNPVI
ncbi:MAG: hypothetical protein COB35_12705 [Gammaproteobacteria bacterium]|nr:MAG: hypothetical protein COB35_12705 [Gammaproteobacteria bacterium]